MLSPCASTSSVSSPLSSFTAKRAAAVGRRRTSGRCAACAQGQRESSGPSYHDEIVFCFAVRSDMLHWCEIPCVADRGSQMQEISWQVRTNRQYQTIDARRLYLQSCLDHR